ncbi:hypothetical protein [Hymenobacter terrenus]|uniref:hypothetical protein n=1 Tax=Hymenobacter terrenus TaxID=1629124 RepID=UPI000AB6E123|nr:hypothetical protein [Hymenobacter terrenus]
MKNFLISLFRGTFGIALGVLTFLTLGLVVALSLNLAWIHNTEGKDIVSEGGAFVSTVNTPATAVVNDSSSAFSSKPSSHE